MTDDPLSVVVWIYDIYMHMRVQASRTTTQVDIAVVDVASLSAAALTPVLFRSAHGHGPFLATAGVHGQRDSSGNNNRSSNARMWVAPAFTAVRLTSTAAADATCLTRKLATDFLEKLCVTIPCHATLRVPCAYQWLVLRGLSLKD